MGTGLIQAGERGVQLRSLSDFMVFAENVVRSGLAPKGDNAATVAMKLQTGAELGFTPMQSLSVVTSINGRAGLMGVGALARLRTCGQLAGPILMGMEGDGDSRHAWIETRRKGEEETMRSEFSMADAKRAGLAGGNVYKLYPDDMLTWRAVGRHVKRHWSDVLLGIDLHETIIDVQPVMGRSLAAAPEVAGPDPLLSGASEPEPIEVVEIGAIASMTVVDQGRATSTFRGCIVAMIDKANPLSGEPWWLIKGTGDAGEFQCATEDDLVAQATHGYIGTGAEVVCTIEETGKLPRLVSIEAGE